MPPARASRTRTFSNKIYITDFTMYATREEANARVQELKEICKVSARIIPRKEGFLIYFEQSCYQSIFGEFPEGLDLEIPPIVAEIENSETGNVNNGISQNKTAKRASKNATKRVGKKSARKGTRVPNSPNAAPNLQSVANTPPSANSNTQMIIGPPPPYLFARMNKDAQRYYLARESEFQRLNPRQVDKLMEVFHSELLKFDAKFEKEVPVLTRIKEIVELLNRLKFKNDDQVVREFCEQRIRTPLNEGKFDKVLQKLAGYNGRTVADGIIKILGRTRKDWPLSDIALEQEIITILNEKFPGKFPEK